MFRIYYGMGHSGFVILNKDGIVNNSILNVYYRNIIDIGKIGLSTVSFLRNDGFIFNKAVFKDSIEGDKYTSYDIDSWNIKIRRFSNIDINNVGILDIIDENSDYYKKLIGFK